VQKDTGVGKPTDGGCVGEKYSFKRYTCCRVKGRQVATNNCIKIIVSSASPDLVLNFATLVAGIGLNKRFFPSGYVS
jgi:hypothetical protein